MHAYLAMAVGGGVLIVLGGLFGALWQDRIHEDQRRRLAERRRALNEMWRSAVDLAEHAEFMLSAAQPAHCCRALAGEHICCRHASLRDRDSMADTFLLIRPDRPA